MQSIHTKCEGHESVLIIDSCSVHKKREVTLLGTKYNIIIVYVPPGMTPKLQPLDVGVFGPLKNKYLRYYEDVAYSNLQNFTYESSLDCFLHCWSNITADVIQKAFDKAFISLNT